MASSSSFDLTRWQRLNVLLDEALPLEPDAQRAWLESLQEQDAELVPRLRHILSRDTRETREFLSRPVVLPELMHTLAGKQDAAGVDIGPYRLIAELGCGGMASVWTAERSDGAIKRQIALKLPISRWTVGLTERMFRERDILASLEHPNIARLYDAGVTDEGRPYLALEYVEGKPIDVYCNAHGLDVRSRLQLFLQIAQAMSHAHGRLVVHRDLKPNNILVTANGDVRLLDFGIAKLLSPDAGTSNAPDSQLTRFTGRPLTLDYASPEQIRSERVTIASDVYSLGVVLYELLTGKRPYKPKRNSAAALEDAITEQEAPPASHVADKNTAKELHGDLDAILSKALKKEIAERYPSVESFATDITRYLVGEPVLAQPDSTWYRTRKFVSRNLGAVAAGAAIVVAISAGAGVAVWQAYEARIEANRAEEVKKFVASVFSSAVPRTGVGGEVLATDLLTAAGVRIEKELAGNPKVAAELGVIVGESFAELGKPALAEQTLRVATAKAEQEFGRRHVISLRGKLQLAAIIKHPDPKTAVAMLDEIISDAKTMLPAGSEQLVGALYEKGFISSIRGVPDEAYAALKESVAVAEQYLGPNSKAAIASLGMLSSTYGSYGRTIEQLATATDSLRRAEQEFGVYRPNITLLEAERSFAMALRASDRPEDAIPLLQRVIDDQRKLDAAETGRVRYAMHELGKTLAVAGHIDEAIILQRKVVVFEREQNKAETVNRVIAGVPLVSSLLTARRVDEAFAEEERIFALQQRIGDEPLGIHLIRLNRLALLHALRGNSAVAERTALEVAKLAQTKFPHARLGALRIQAFNARMQRNPAKALSYMKDAAQIKLPPPVSLQNQFVDAAENGAALLDLARFDEAEKALTDCRQLYEKAQVKLSVRVSTCVVGLARIQLRSNKSADADKALTALVLDWEKVNPNSEWHGESLYWLARAKAQLGHEREAREMLVRAKTMLRKSSLPVLRHLLVQTAPD